MSDFDYRKAIREAVANAVEDDAKGGELLLKEVWEDCSDDDYLAAKQEALELAAWIRGFGSGSMSGAKDKPAGFMRVRFDVSLGNGESTAVVLVAEPKKLIDDKVINTLRILMEVAKLARDGKYIEKSGKRVGLEP